PAAGIAEAADTLDQRRLERRPVAPALAEPFGVGALERAPEADARVAHRDHHHPPAEPPAESVGLHRHPAARAGVLHNILACFRKRHTEPQRRLHLESQLAVKDARGALGDLLDHFVHVLGGPDRGDVEQDIRGSRGGRLRHLAVQLEQLGRIGEEARAGPVALHLVAGRHREQRPFVLPLRQRLPGREHREQAIGRGPLRAAGIEQHLFLGRPAAERGGELLEGTIVERRGHFDDARHGTSSSPRRWRLNPPAPRSAALRDAMAVACRSAVSTGSPARSRAHAAAPKTSPQPVGSRTSTRGAGINAVRAARPTGLPGADRSGPAPADGASAWPGTTPRRPHWASESNPGAATYAAPRAPRVTSSSDTPDASAWALSESGSGDSWRISSSFT